MISYKLPIYEYHISIQNSSFDTFEVKIGVSTPQSAIEIFKESCFLLNLEENDSKIVFWRSSKTDCGFNIKYIFDISR